MQGLGPMLFIVVHLAEVGQMESCESAQSVALGLEDPRVLIRGRMPSLLYCVHWSSLNERKVEVGAQDSEVSSLLRHVARTLRHACPRSLITRYLEAAVGYDARDRDES